MKRRARVAVTAVAAYLLVGLTYLAVVLARTWPQMLSGEGDQPIADQFTATTFPWFVGVNAVLCVTVMGASIVFMLWTVWHD